MTRFDQMVPPDRKRLYRNKTDRMIGGVCSGIADFAGWDRWLVRLFFIIAVFITAGLPLMTYIGLWIFLHSEPQHLFHDEQERSFWQSVNMRPSGTINDLARKFSDLDDRLVKMERNVTSRDYELEREFRNLRTS